MNERISTTILEHTAVRRAALLAAGVILAATGCTNDSHSGDIQATPKPSTAASEVAQTPEITREQLIQDPRLLAKTHDTLPPKVQKAASATVRLLNYTEPTTEYIYADGKVQHSQDGLYVPGSGSIVKAGGKNMVITAAHVVEETDEHCGTEEVHYQSENGAVLGGVRSQYALFSSVLNLGQKPDIAMLSPQTTVERPNDGQSELAMPLRKNVSAVTGDEVFIAGYAQPLAGEEQRDPQKYGNEGQPNLHNALLLGQSNGYLVILDGSGKSFAPGSASNETLPGNSGGPVIDKDGYEIGVISGNALLPSYIQKTAHSFGVDIDPKGYSVTFAQIVNQASADELASQALAAQPCTDLPPLQLPAQ